MNSDRNHAFTLIELLVVIGVVVMTSAIAFSAVASARKSVRPEVCDHDKVILLKWSMLDSMDFIIRSA